MNTKPSSSPLGPRRTLVAIAVILAVGALAATLILRSGPPGAAKADSHGHGHSEAAGHADGEHHGAAAAAADGPSTMKAMPTMNTMKTPRRKKPRPSLPPNLRPNLPPNRPQKPVMATKKA